MGGRNADDHGRVKEEEDQEEEESLSLCDLPINEGNISNNLKQSSNNDSSVAYNNNNKDDDGEELEEAEEEFNFCDSFKISKEYSEMCAADELFFQGQILPLGRRHSVSSCTDTDTDTVSNRTGRLQTLQSDYIHIGNASISRSESDSLDRCYSGGLTSTAASSRSSSINSHHSSSSGSSSIFAAASKHKKLISRARPPRLVPNNFQYSSHPSPKPQIRTPAGIKNSNPNSNSNSNRNSGLWSLFRVGLMTPPEIAIRDLKNRSNSIKNYNPQSFGSRNSTSSSNSSNNTNTAAKRKQPPFFLNKNGVLLFGGCKCTANSVGPNPRKIGHDIHGRSGEVITENGHGEEMKNQAKKMTKHQQTGGGGKQALSRHRTFEWLKQLSLEAASSAMDQT